MTSAVASTSSARDLTPYWSSSVREMSNKLWLPTRTGLRDLDLSLSNGLQTNTLQNSWFSTTLASAPSKSLLRTCFPSFISSPADFTASEAIVRRSRKIRIYPNAGQRAILKQWLGASRKFYNEAVAYLKQPDTKAIRTAVKSLILGQAPEWAKEIPYAIKGDSILEACNTISKVKRANSKIRSTGGSFQEARFRSRKDPIQSLPLQSANVRDGQIYKTKLGVLKTSERIQGTSDGRLTLENGRWFYVESQETTVTRPENQRQDAVAIDPGVRTFATIYSPDLTGKIGQADSSKLFRLCLRLDELISKLTAVRAKARYRIKKAIQRLRWRIKDLVTELHWKTARFLCENFKNIFLPTFKTKDMVCRIGRKINKESVRKMLTLSHYSFKLKVKEMAKKLGSRVFDVNEAFTSKTCSACGRLHNIGSSKTLRCYCGNVIDRDINGARGIFLRALRDLSCTLA